MCGQIKNAEVYGSIQYLEINLPWAHSDFKYLYIAAFYLQLSPEMWHFIQVWLLSTLA